MKCDRCNRGADSLMESPLFVGEKLCDGCWSAEEDAFIEVTTDLERHIDKIERWPLYWRVLAKVAEKPEEHIGFIKWCRERKVNHDKRI